MRRERFLLKKPKGRGRYRRSARNRRGRPRRRKQAAPRAHSTNKAGRAATTFRNAYYMREWPFSYFPSKRGAFTRYTEATLAWPPYPGGGQRYVSAK